MATSLLMHPSVERYSPCVFNQVSPLPSSGAIPPSHSSGDAAPELPLGSYYGRCFKVEDAAGQDGERSPLYEVCVPDVGACGCGETRAQAMVEASLHLRSCLSTFEVHGQACPLRSSRGDVTAMAAAETADMRVNFAEMGCVVVSEETVVVRPSGRRSK